MKVIDKRVLVKNIEGIKCTQRIGSVDFEIAEDKKEYDTAVILAIAKDCEAEIKVGDKVYVYSKAGKNVYDPETSETVRVITTSDIIAVL